MTVIEWAIYAYAAQRMKPHEKTAAQAWAESADAGDKAAFVALRNLVLDVLRDAKNREKEMGLDAAHDGRTKRAPGSAPGKESGDVG